MRIKKIRGHKRIWADIEKWRSSNLKLDLDNLKSKERDYAKIWIHPFSGYSMLNSQFPEPKGETRKRILSGLLDIYESWKNQLEELNEPYYLKIWLYEPRFSKSQVVCAIGSSIDFYDITFFNPNLNKVLEPIKYGTLENEIEKFKWGYRLDEEHMNNGELGEPDDYYSKEEYHKEKKWFENRLKRPHRLTKYKELFGNVTEGYSFKKGMVWIGEKIE